MSATPILQVGHWSDRGRRPLNQDRCGGRIPPPPLLLTKGAAFAVADGIGSSPVSQVAAEVAVAQFLDDYYATPETWSVKRAGERVLGALNAWLAAHNRTGPGMRERERGYVCTFSALVIRGATAHLFHVGDARIYRFQDGALECLTRDHAYAAGGGRRYLARALGADEALEVDYGALPVAAGDRFLIVTDGLYEALSERALARLLAAGAEPEATCRALAEAALARGAEDNLTALLVRVDAVAPPAPGEWAATEDRPPLPPPLAPGDRLDNLEVVRLLARSHRSSVYLARESASGGLLTLKVPSPEWAEEPARLDRFLLEEWLARRLTHPHLLRAAELPGPRRHLYTAFAYQPGQTLDQWLRDHPRPSLERVREFVEQIAVGLEALHRREVLHCDLRPENLLVGEGGRVVILDLGAARVAGLAEGWVLEDPLPGTPQYLAPEFFLGEAIGPAADLYALGVLTYQLLSGALPYGMAPVHVRSRADFGRLCYRPLRELRPDLPAWVDAAVRKAVHPRPERRQQSPSEFAHQLRHPDPSLPGLTRQPLAERDPVRFWQLVSLVLALLLVAALAAGID